jgi:hypothetical protein
VDKLTFTFFGRKVLSDEEFYKFDKKYKEAMNL